MPSAETKAVKPVEGEQSLAQTSNVPHPLGGVGGLMGFGGSTVVGGSPLLFGGGSMDNPMNFPGYGAGYFGIYSTYRWMLDHPTIRLARAIITAPILASSWFYEHDQDVPVKAVDKITATFDAIRARLIEDALRALDYGWAGFEPIWELDEDQHWVIKRFKPLLVDTTEILVDRGGNLAGLRTSTTGGLLGVPSSDPAAGPGDLIYAKGKAWVYTHDGEAGNLYGRPRLENLRRTAWKDWLDSAQQIQALCGKVSGRQAYAIVPAGGYTDNSGKFRSYAQDAADALTAFAQGRQVVLTSPTLAAALAGGNLDQAAKLAGTAPVTFEVIDFGTEAVAVGGLLDRMRHAEELMFQGYLMPSRAGQEGEHGTKAEAGEMADTAVTGSQLIGNDITGRLQPYVDLMARTNWSIRANKVRLRQSPLNDGKRATYQTVITELLKDPGFTRGFVKALDVDKVVDGIDLPRDGKFDDAAMEAVPAATDAASQPPAPNQPPPKPAPVQKPVVGGEKQ